MRNRFTKAEEDRIHNECVVQQGLLAEARLEERLKEAQSQNTTLHIENNNLTSEKEDIAAELIKLQADHSALINEKDKLADEIRDLEDDVAYYKEDRNYFQRKYEALKAAEAAKEAAQTKLESVVASTTQTHEKMLAELRAEKDKLLQAQIAAKVNCIICLLRIKFLILLSHLLGR